jgi:hypothetical protein
LHPKRSAGRVWFVQLALVLYSHTVIHFLGALPGRPVFYRAPASAAARVLARWGCSLARLWRRSKLDGLSRFKTPGIDPSTRGNGAPERQRDDRSRA